MVNESKHQSSVLVVRAGLGVAVAAALAVGTAPVFATSTNTATISNGGLSVKFDLNLGAVVTGVANSNVDNGLNIVDSHDPGRELQTDEFLFDSTTTSRTTLVSNPTQAGSIVASTGKYVGSPVISYSSSANQFQAVITPRDFNSGNVTDWVYVENVSINNQGIANFKYTCYDYVPQTYTMSTEIPTLYSDYTNNFMYPTSTGSTTTATGSWPQPSITSNGWIGNLDETNNVGIFYTTPTGVKETYGTFSGVGVAPGSSPLGKTNAVESKLTSMPGEILTEQFSVAVGTAQSGPTLIAQQAPATFAVTSSLVANGVFSANAADYTQSNGTSGASTNPANPTGWVSSGTTGVNGPDTQLSSKTPFAPASTAGVSDFAFLQNSGSSISQTVSTTQDGTEYTLAFDGAAMNSESSASMKVLIKDAITGQTIDTYTPTITDAGFTPFFLNFTATSGSTLIEFLNTSSTSSDTVDVSNVSLAPVPEPTALGLLTVGCGLVLARRRRRA